MLTKTLVSVWSALAVNGTDPDQDIEENVDDSYATGVFMRITNSSTAGFTTAAKILIEGSPDATSPTDWYELTSAFEGSLISSDIVENFFEVDSTVRHLRFTVSSAGPSSSHDVTVDLELVKVTGI